VGLPLVQEVVGRLTADKPDRERDMLVLAALDGTGALSGYLDGNQARPVPPTSRASRSRASAASARSWPSTCRPAPA